MRLGRIFRSTSAVLTLLFMVAFAGFGQDKTASSISVTNAPHIGPDQIKAYHYLNSGGGLYYATKSDTFLLDLVAANSIGVKPDTLEITIDGKVFKPQPGPILITGLHHGDVSIGLKYTLGTTTKKVKGRDKIVGKPVMPQLPAKIKFKFHSKKPLITNDAAVLGLLIIMLGLIFWSSSSKRPGFVRFYKVIPMLLLCYFLPSLLNTFGIVSGESSKLYFVASRYLLPASLVLLTLSIDIKEMLKLGPKALVMFFTATIGVVLGGPLAVLIVASFSPESVGGAGPDEVWRGLSTVAGSWIGGGANQAAMYEIFGASDRLYSVMITVDILVAEVWMFFLLLGVGKAQSIDRYFKADSSSISTLQKKMEDYSLSIAKIPSTSNLMVILGVAFGAVGIAHLLADTIAPYIEDHFPKLSMLSLNSAFFWLIIIATAVGLTMSFTKARNLEGYGASKVGTLFIYVLVATIGMKMDVTAILSNPGAFLVGGIWMLFHIILLFVVGKIIKAPYFFLAVGSKANIGGAASAPVVAAAFHPSLAPVGVLLAVFGYIIGTGAAWVCGLMMQGASPL